ncbi:MAG TPA: T9SS type A sorting domain-containing protein, partial [Flavisolibacter sp.]|nr:T9SS type A sorting domain-containing protein [Flavisolibacter sp.]
TIYVYINGSTTAAASTTVASGGTWALSGLTVAAGDLITAKAQAAGESLCLVSNTFRVTNCANPSSRPSTPLLSCGPAITKGMTGTNKSTGWTVWVTNTTRNTTDNSSTNTGAIFEPETGISPNISWMYSSGCSGGANMTSGSYRIWYTDANGCQSDPIIACQAGNGGSSLAGSAALIAPVVTSPAVFTVATKSVTGTASAGSTVNLYINGILAGTAVTTGSISTSATGTFVITGLNVNENDVISLTCEYNTGTISTSYCGSKGVTTYTAGCYTTPPVININATTGQLAIGQPITGTSAEPAGTTIKLYNSGNTVLATTTVQANGSWTTTGAIFSNGFTGTAAAGTTYYATATKSVCSSLASANAATATSVTSARCGSITTSPIMYTATGISGTLTGTPAAGTAVNLYEDGYVIGSFTTASNNWGPVDVTNKLYSGNGTTTGRLTFGIQESGKEEITCPAAATVTCSGPLLPSYTQQSSNGTTGSGATVPQGGTMTYTITNLSPSTFYSIADAVTGKTYASGVWTTSSTVTSNNIVITTNPLTTSGTYNGVLKATSVTSADMCSTPAANSSFMVLPVTLLDFKAVPNIRANLLTWKTSTEITLHRFEIEKSSDGSSFEEIGKVLATGAGTYSFTDNNLVSAASYYRLKMIDNDGRLTYSKVIMVKQDNAISITAIRPNPFIGEVALQLTVTKNEMVNILLLDEKGRQVVSKKTAVQSGTTTVMLSNLQHLSAGVYLMQIIAGDKTLRQKIVKL